MTDLIVEKVNQLSRELAPNWESREELFASALTALLFSFDSNQNLLFDYIRQLAEQLARDHQLVRILTNNPNGVHEVLMRTRDRKSILNPKEIRINCERLSDQLFRKYTQNDEEVEEEEDIVMMKKKRVDPPMVTTATAEVHPQRMFSLPQMGFISGRRERGINDKKLKTKNAKKSINCRKK